MTPHQILKAAQDLIRDPKHWTQGAFARDAHGGPVPLKSVAAVCFCSAGAIEKAAGDAPEAEQSARRLLRSSIIDSYPCSSIWHFNDNYTHAQVMAAFTKALEQ